MANNVSIVSDSCTLNLSSRPVIAGDPALEFASGSFTGAVDERRVANVNLTVAGGTFSLRFEFTDPTMANTDIWGEPTYLTKESRIAPYQEAVGAKAKLNNPDVTKG
jgi:hypothetical protein